MHSEAPPIEQEGKTLRELEQLVDAPVVLGSMPVREVNILANLREARERALEWKALLQRDSFSLHDREASASFSCQMTIAHILDRLRVLILPGNPDDQYRLKTYERLHAFGAANDAYKPRIQRRIVEQSVAA